MSSMPIAAIGLVAGNTSASGLALPKNLIIGISTRYDSTPPPSMIPPTRRPTM
ncbi:hypothetical protein OV079_46155 [Nannocystis pusilla]|uniref:Uncharacterized protein n=1 Tax=Nannocystis pusilla TaxID=889268 RepID=A0A9X3F054_9BACT|nr:hypothetical protein [Nannocystis pusilla]MCY1012800.1 hypothetical protein [Nannocystis pusilla]